MKFVIPLIVLALSISSCMNNQNFPTPEEIEKKVIELEKQALDQWSNGNPLGYATHFAEDATYMDDIAAQKRLNNLQEIKKYFKMLEGKISPHSYKMIDTKVQSFGDVAILTFQYHASVGEESGPPWKASCIYVLSEDKWQVKHANWSLITKK